MRERLIGNVSDIAATGLLALMLLGGISAGLAQSSDKQTQITGAWRGSSECAVKNSACHDEINVYRFMDDASHPGMFSGTGFRVANGKEISMGTLLWQYDAKSQILTSSTPNGAFRLVVSDDKLEGTLTLIPDGTIFRRIHLTREQ